MIARIRKLLNDLREAFWLVPALFVGFGILLALGLVRVDREGVTPEWLIEGKWLYSGGATGARTLLGAVAASTIGVAGTVFSITIAALTLAAGQMGPRLLRNFMRDRGNQVTLGIYLGTFTYALMVLRSVRTVSEGEFVPHLSLGVGMLLAVACVATLVYFVGHIAGRINVDTVIELVSHDAQAAVRSLASRDPPPEPPSEDLFRNAVPVVDRRRGYLQQLDSDGLADWAVEHKVAIRMLVRAGDYVFPGTPVALISRETDGAEKAVVDATALGHHRGSLTDLEFALRQMVEVAVRALSPGINDPHTAISVLDRLGATLCDLAPLHLPGGTTIRDGAPVVTVPAIDYDDLAGIMFNMIRRYSVGNADVMIRLLEVLASVMSCERNPARLATLLRHAELVMNDSERSIANRRDLEHIRDQYRRLDAVRRHGSRALCAKCERKAAQDEPRRAEG